MELIGRLKKKVDQAASKEEARELIEQAGMKLTDEELEMVSGGVSGGGANACLWDHVSTTPGRVL